MVSIFQSIYIQVPNFEVTIVKLEAWIAKVSLKKQVGHIFFHIFNGLIDLVGNFDIIRIKISEKQIVAIPDSGDGNIKRSTDDVPVLEV